MTLSHVLGHLEDLDLLDAIADGVKDGGTVSVEDLPDATRPLLAASAIDRTDGNVIIVSDHGFDVEPRGEALVAHHNRAPDGVFLAAGPAFRSGRVDGLTVFDVLPVLLYLKGWPLAEDFAGRLPADALRPALLEAQPPTRIASYGTRRRSSSWKSGRNQSGCS